MKLMRRLVVVSTLLLLAINSTATVLTFYAGEGTSYAMPQDYGDNVTSTLDGIYSYGENGEGFTPNVTIEYIGDGGNGLHYWRDDFSGTAGVLVNEDDGEDFTTVKFTAAAGTKVILHSLMWSSWSSDDFTVDSITVTDESSNELFNSGSFQTGGSHATINFGSITGQVLTLTASLTSAGNSNDSFGFDDITFSQTGGNLLLNPSFSEDLGSWTTDLGTPYLLWDTARARTGNLLFYFSGPAGGQIHQDVDLLEAGYLASDINAGHHDVVFGGWQNSHEGLDLGQISVEFLNAAQQELGTASLPSAAPSGWTHFLATNQIPAQTTTLRYVFSGTFVSGGNSLDVNAYLDDVFMGVTGLSRPPVELIVESVHGEPVPMVGSHSYFSGSVVTCSVEHVNGAARQYECMGWTGTGSVPSSGISNAVDVTLTEDSSITWNWQTNYWLQVNATGNGSINTATSFYSKDSAQNLVATPDAGWLFMGWSGDASGTNTAVVTMDAPKGVMATFSDDADGDGLTNTEEAGHGSNPWKSDTDGDGFDDAFEVAQGLPPTVNNSAITDYIANHGSTFELYPSSVVLDVAVGQMLIETSGGTATLSLQLEESGDLINWTNAGPAKVWSWPVGSEKQFFRVRSGE